MTYFKYFRNGKELVKTINIVPEYEEDTATLHIKKMAMDLDGDYKCVAENSAGTAETLAKITVEGITFLCAGFLGRVLLV